MQLFSQRTGITPSSKIAQVDGIDEELRNGLWDTLCRVWPNYSEYGLGHTTMAIFEHYWHLYFKEPIDTIPGNINLVIGYFRNYFFFCEWFEAYNFMEFTAKNYPYGDADFFTSYANIVLERENSAYRFVGNQIIQITSPIEIDSIEEALQATGKIASINTHLSTSIEHLSSRQNPDLRNSVKESISAVEAACILIADDPHTTLGAVLADMERDGDLHRALAQSFRALYGYTSDADGIRHALLDEPRLTYTDAKYMLVACSAFVNYLIGKRLV